MEHPITQVDTRRLKTLAKTLLLLSLAGCGGGSGPNTQSSGSDVPLVSSGGVASNVTTINGITVPSDPGAASKSTLAGIDANENGIRDDVERELAAHYGRTPIVYAAAFAFAKKIQAPLGQPSSTSADATAAVTNELLAFECFAVALDNRDDALAAAQLIAARTFNTKNRLAEQTRNYELSGLEELPEVGVPSCN